MKNTFTHKAVLRTAGIIAIAAIMGIFFGLSVTGCNRGGGGSGEGGGASASEDNAAKSTATAGVPGNLGRGKTAAFFKMFSGKNYHLKAKSTFSGRDVIVETFIKDDMIATAGETGGMSYRSIKRDNKVYVINDQAKTVMVMPISASSGNTPEEPVRTDGMLLTSSGIAQFNGKNLPYEEYSSTGSDVKIQLFLDGKKLAGIRTISGKTTIDMIILALDQKVPNSVFEIPVGYQRIGL